MKDPSRFEIRFLATPQSINKRVVKESIHIYLTVMAGQMYNNGPEQYLIMHIWPMNLLSSHMFSVSYLYAFQQLSRFIGPIVSDISAGLYIYNLFCWPAILFLSYHFPYLSTFQLLIHPSTSIFRTQMWINCWGENRYERIQVLLHFPFSDINSTVQQTQRSVMQTCKHE